VKARNRFGRFWRIEDGFWHFVDLRPPGMVNEREKRFADTFSSLRRSWFEQYQTGKLTLDGARYFALLIADAVDRDLAKGKDWRQ
jgi:hypothetical protein